MVEKAELVPFTSEEKKILGLASKVVAKGWCQRVARYNERSCLVEAIEASVIVGPPYDLPNKVVRSQALHDKIAKRLGIVCSTGWESRGALFAWNDEPWRTQAEVVTLLKGLSR